ncbi:MAG: citrate (Si)-synthase, partial [Pseudomonadota bacterium]|nr:citrate (Si)-synthase [Pseudomonadota bacterium]
MSANDAKLAGLNSLGKTYDFGINEGTVGPSVIDVSSLYAQTGQFTYDPGFTS